MDFAYFANCIFHHISGYFMEFRIFHVFNGAEAACSLTFVSSLPPRKQ